MKKTLSLILAFSMIFTFGCSVKQKKEVVKPEKKEVQTIEEPVKNDEFYDMMQTNERPVAVMIDNDVSTSRPQMGLESAYMVYEIVVEGGSTRLMALFKNHDLEKVGPVRSSRHYFLDYALEHDAIYCHAGWSPQASRDISLLGVNNINGIMGSDGSIYWRDNTYDKSWHNLYTGVDKVYDMAVNQKKYRGETDIKHDSYYTHDTAPENGEDAVKVYIPYADFYKVSYEYDSENKNYKRYVNGSYHMSQDGSNLTAKNIIIYQLSNYALNDGENKGRQNLENTGSGNGYYLTDGKVMKINWQKNSRGEKTRYTLENGEELILNPGNTYIQIVPKYINTQIS